jgi:hypothetical protein
MRRHHKSQISDIGEGVNQPRSVFRIMRIFSWGLTWCKLHRGYPAAGFLSAALSRSRSSGGRSEAGRTSCPAVISAEAPLKLEIPGEPDAQDVQAVQQAIYAYNRSKAGDQQYEHLTIFLRDSRCKHARLDTFSFQAKGFYEKLGYVAFGALDGFPGEHRRYFLRKKLEI